MTGDELHTAIQEREVKALKDDEQDIDQRPELSFLHLFPPCDFLTDGSRWFPGYQFHHSLQSSPRSFVADTIKLPRRCCHNPTHSLAQARNCCCAHCSRSQNQFGLVAVDDICVKLAFDSRRARESLRIEARELELETSDNLQ